MKKYLLPEKGNYYKANLHCHSDVSDGEFSPAEIKRIYKEKGYSVVAYTDHNVMIPHPELADSEFLPLTGYEIDLNLEDYSKVCHICLIALSPETKKQICYHRTKYCRKNAEINRDKVVFDENEPDFIREYTPECINEIMRRGRESGFYVTYNHPTWSMENYADYIAYNHMHAMEICNYGCMVAGYPEYNEHEYDDMLRVGKKIFCIGADDNHNHVPLESRNSDSFGAFTMIRAEKLDYTSIIDAMLKGDFYASQGPEIYSLWFEDSKVHITCSDADSIAFTTGVRRAGVVYAEGDSALNSASSFDISADDVYVRVTVTDKDGKHANTNAYFVADLLD